MDTKRLILNITLMLTLVVGYQLLMRHWAKVYPTAFTPANTPPAVVATTAPVGSAPTTWSTTNPVLVAAPTGLQGVSAPTTQPTQPLTLGVDKAFPMELSIEPRGAGLSGVVLSDFYETAARKARYKFQEPIKDYESITTPLATRGVSIHGQYVDLSAVIWKRTAATPDSATYTTLVSDGNKPVLELSKTFKLAKKDDKNGSGYDIQVNQSFRNVSDHDLTDVVVTFNGPTPPSQDNSRYEDRRYVAGYDDSYGTHGSVKAGDTLVSDLKKTSASKAPDQLKAEGVAKDLVAADALPTVWVGTCSSYFESIIRPDAKQTVTIASALAAQIDRGPNAETTTPEGKSIVPTQFAICTNSFSLPKNAPAATMNARVFFGPKQRDLLKDSYYAAFPLMYDTTLLFKSGICGKVTFNWIIDALYGILWFFHAIFRDWGIAIICLVALVRSLLHPITKRSQINMVEMSKKGPELERLKKKFADDKEALMKAQAELMNPAGMLLGCAPMFLQTPIWLALYAALQMTFDLRQAPFLWFGRLHLTWIADLSQPDRLITFPTYAVNLLFTTVHLSEINVLPLLLAVVFFVNASLQPAPPNMTPEQEQQRKMMKWMSMLFPVFLYFGPSGLNLYILTSTTIGIIESKIIRNHIKDRDEAEKAGRIIVDAGPTRGSKRRRDGDDPGSLVKGGKKPSPKTGGLTGWLANLQEQAEKARREAARRGNK